MGRAGSGAPEWRSRNIAAAPKLDLAGRDINRCNPADPVLIPRLDEWTEPENYARGPGWAPVYRQGDNGEKIWLKPHIRCICGAWTGIGLHHVHADGRVTASFFDATAEQLAAMGDAGKRFSAGCGWHVFIKLDGYDRGEFLPNQETRAPDPPPAPPPPAPGPLIRGGSR